MEALLPISTVFQGSTGLEGRLLVLLFSPLKLQHKFFTSFKRVFTFSITHNSLIFQPSIMPRKKLCFSLKLYQ